MAAACFFQQVVHVLEILHMPTLVRGNGYGVGIFLYGTVHHLLHTPVVAQVYHLGTAGLHNAAHDIDRRIVAIE